MFRTTGNRYTPKSWEGKKVAASKKSLIKRVKKNIRTKSFSQIARETQQKEAAKRLENQQIDRIKQAEITRRQREAEFRRAE